MSLLTPVAFWKPLFPVTEFSFECAQWRPGLEPEMFVGHIYFDNDAVDVSGALECHIHAEVRERDEEHSGANSRYALEGD
jgi:hypothetical protein